MTIRCRRLSAGSGYMSGARGSWLCIVASSHGDCAYVATVEVSCYGSIGVSSWPAEDQIKAGVPISAVKKWQ